MVYSVIKSKKALKNVPEKYLLVVIGARKKYLTKEFYINYYALKEVFFKSAALVSPKLGAAVKDHFPSSEKL